MEVRLAPITLEVECDRADRCEAARSRASRPPDGFGDFGPPNAFEVDHIVHRAVLPATSAVDVGVEGVARVPIAVLWQLFFGVELLAVHLRTT